MPSKPNAFQPKIRLYIDLPLREGVAVSLTKDQAHYLGTVMRQSVGDHVLLFNGADGEWAAHLDDLTRKGGTATPIEQTKPQDARPDIWLLFAPIKRARFDMVVEKATELGVARIAPVLTRYAGHDRVKQARMHAIAVEAAEQCGGNSLPVIEEPVKLDALLASWPQDRPLYFCDERRGAQPFQMVLSAHKTNKGALLIGPEGGFSPEEQAMLDDHPTALAVTLGPRILRAETACLSALTIWQTAHGDWQ
ncbi:MAG: 16S rRNA (uracil(1498)-N(3))-methyltransferase [Alphaproteobacteria bacterium]